MFKKPKYGNKKTVIDGISFDSKNESKMYQLLNLLIKAKKIDGFERQKRFTLQDKFLFEGKTILGISYIADFVVTRGDKTDVIDCKGYVTETFKMKRKMFINRYGYDILVTKTNDDYLLYLRSENGN